MKTYHEMVQFIVDQVDNGILRYYEWPVVIALAEVYNIPRETIAEDIKFEKEFRKQAEKAQRKAESRASNEERRLANLAKNSGPEKENNHD